MYARSEPSKWLDRSIWILGALVAIVIVGFGAYYVRDRYLQPNVSLVERETKHLEELVQQDPQNITTRLSVAQAYLSGKMYDQAIAQFQEALKIEENNEGAILGLAMAYTATGDDEGALRYFSQLVELNEDKDSARVDRRLNIAHYEMGRIFLEHNDIDRAIEEFTAALAINRADADALYQLGTAYMAKGDFADAADAFQVATAFVPDFVEAYQSMAVAYEKNGEPDKALYAKAMVSYATGSYAEAAAQLEKVVAALPDFLEAHYALASTYDLMGQVDKAIPEYERVVELDATHRMANSRLQQLTGGEQ